MSVDYPNDTKAMLVQQQEAVCFIFGLTVDKEVGERKREGRASRQSFEREE